MPVCPSEKISVREALRVYTRHSAYAGLGEGIKGSIVKGKLAENPLSVPEERLRDIVVDSTIVDGRVVYRSKART